MRRTRIIMGMPVIIEIADPHVTENDFDIVFSYFNYIDEKFSTYKTTSEITQINNKKITKHDYSDDMV